MAMYSYRIYQVADGEWVIRRSVWRFFEVEHLWSGDLSETRGWTSDRAGRYHTKISAAEALRHTLAIEGVSLSAWRKIAARNGIKESL